MSKLSISLIVCLIINNILGKTEDLVSEDLLKYEKKEYINFFKVPDTLIVLTLIIRINIIIIYNNKTINNINNKRAEL